MLVMINNEEVNLVSINLLLVHKNKSEKLRECKINERK